MELICEYFEDALIFIDFKNKNKYDNEPYLVVKMDCDNAEDILLLNNYKWENNSLNTDWANELVNWAKKHISEILTIWETESIKLISERWSD